MKHQIRNSTTFIGALLFALTTSCTRDILDQKPDKSQVVPVSLQDFQALLDNSSTIFSTNNIGPLEIAAGDYYLTDADYLSLTSATDRNSYLWKEDIWEGVSSVTEWDQTYKQVFYTNVVLDGLQGMSVAEADAEAYNRVKGMALFLRSNAFYNLAQLFAGAYESATAANDRGIPLRLEADMNLPTTRATVAATYARILQDLGEAAKLLPETTENKYRPGKSAAYGLLARVNLAMRNYEEAGLYADSSLYYQSGLIDYNSLNATAGYPVSNLNTEVIIRFGMTNYTSWQAARGKVPKEFIDGYDDNDLRKQVFFTRHADGSGAFKGNYTGSRVLFTGLATDELLLIRAEGYARSNRLDKCAEDLNSLLVKRYKTGTFSGLSLESAEQALDRVLEERRKELLFRGLRWGDLRRLNKEAGREITLNRIIGGMEYRLEPGSPRYVFPIPEYIIALTGIEQNPR